MKTGFDANRDLTRYAECLKSMGFSFVCRYYNINNPSKNLTYAEASCLSLLGLEIVAVWENGYPTNSGYFSESKGYSDGIAAYEYATNTIRQPKDTAIYFAVDYDASESETNGCITEYFKGVNEAFTKMSGGGPGYFIGVYGSGLVCSKIIAGGLATYSWLAQSMGWRGSRTYNSYSIKQLLEVTECIEAGTIAGDPNESPNGIEGSFSLASMFENLKFVSADKPLFKTLNDNYSEDRHECPDIKPEMNQCAIRLSRALKLTGLSLDADYKGKKCRDNFARGAQDLAAFLLVKWGTYQYGFENPNAVPQQIVGKKGVILFANIPEYGEAQGHIDIWDGEKTRTGSYWNANPIWFWTLP